MDRGGDSAGARTALFGGTFDPVHSGHIEIARAAATRFHLDKVLFVPAANPPHKPGGPVASYEDRFSMVQLACAVDSRFEPSRIEAGFQRSYSIRTIEKLRAPGALRLFFLIGADAFAEIRTWYRWQDVVAAVEFIVVARPGAPWEVPPGALAHELAGLDIPISSSGIRAQLMSGISAVAVPPPVLDYIRNHGLYRSHTA